MDVYGICRLFRSFNKTPLRNSLLPRTSIFLAGDFHTDRYIKVLKDIGFVKVFDSYGLDTFVDMKKVNIEL
jgi:hypothetical protein